MRADPEAGGGQDRSEEGSRGGRLRRFVAARPTSYYLFFAMIVVVLLGLQVVYIREDPRRLGLFLALNFAFFVVVIGVALGDVLGIVRAAFREREKSFSATLGEKQFVENLRERVDSRRRAH